MHSTPDFFFSRDFGRLNKCRRRSFERKWKLDLEKSGNKTDFYRIYILSLLSSPLLSPLHFGSPSFPLSCTHRVGGREEGAVALHSLWGLWEEGSGREIPQTIGTGSDFMQSESIPPPRPPSFALPLRVRQPHPSPSSNKPVWG